MKRRGASFEHGPGPTQPHLRPGEKLWRLKRRPGEDGKQAIERARAMPWWCDVLVPVPFWTSEWWMFVAKEAV